MKEYKILIENDEVQLYEVKNQGDIVEEVIPSEAISLSNKLFQHLKKTIKGGIKKNLTKPRFQEEVQEIEETPIEQKTSQVDSAAENNTETELLEKRTINVQVVKEKTGLTEYEFKYLKEVEERGMYAGAVRLLTDLRRSGDHKHSDEYTIDNAMALIKKWLIEYEMEFGTINTCLLSEHD